MRRDLDRLPQWGDAVPGCRPGESGADPVATTTLDDAHSLAQTFVVSTEVY
jgi:hypothetical protein